MVYNNCALYMQCCTNSAVASTAVVKREVNARSVFQEHHLVIHRDENVKEVLQQCLLQQCADVLLSW